MRLFKKRILVLVASLICATNMVLGQETSPGASKSPEQNSTTVSSAAKESAARDGGSKLIGPPPPQPFPEAKLIAQPKNNAEMAAAITKLGRDLASSGRFSGSVLVAADGKALINQAWGDADREHKIANTSETAYDVGSIGKLFTQIAVLQLVEGDKVTLDDAFGKYLTNYPDGGIAGKVTVRQLLLHTSGMADIFDGVTPDTNLGSKRELKDFLPLFAHKPLEFAPGSQTRYSNTGYIVLGMIVEAVSGENYYDYIQQHILKPAGLTHSGFFDRTHLPPGVAHSYDDGHDVTSMHAARGSPAGGLQASTGDLLNLVKAIQAGSLVSGKSIKMLRDLIPHPPNATPSSNETKFVAYGIAGGAPGVSAQIAIDPSGHYTRVVLCNASPPMAMSMSATIAEWIKQIPN